MGQLLQDIFLSDFMVIVVIGLLLIFVTIWTFTLREWVGYALGWLLGIFLIILISTLIPESRGVEPLEPETARLSFFELLIPSVIGLAGGFGSNILIRGGGSSDSKLQRGLTVATLLTVTLVAGYIVLLTTRQFRLVIGVFLLTFAIGLLLQYLFSRGQQSRVRDYRAQAQQQQPDNRAGGEQEPQRNDRVQQRLDAFRDRLRNRRPPE